MPDSTHTTDNAGRPGHTRSSRATSERQELLAHLQALLEPAMVGLGLLFLVLLVLDYLGIFADQREGIWLSHTLTVIWAIFVVDFVVRFAIAPRKLEFLKSNWLSAASLALPFLRPFRALRAARAVRSISLVRLLGGVNRGMRVLRQVAGGHQIAYLSALTLLVALMGATGVWYFDRGQQDSSIRSFGDALWWAAAMVTTINNEKYAVSPEARVIAILLRVYAVSVFGFITATIATYLIGRRGVEAADERSDDLRRQLDDLRRELVLLRQTLAEQPLTTARPGVADRDLQMGEWHTASDR
jgi:voltage-gated potassium channel